MSLAVDFAWSRPAPSSVVGLGYAGVIGYLTHDRTGKAFTDWARYASAGLGVALVFEDSAGRALGGYGAGAADAQFANDQADSWGYPGGLLFYACDTDVGTNTGPVVDYCRGARSVGRREVGIYGSFYVVEDCLNTGAAVLGWQTVAWSRGNHSDRAALYQYARPTPLAGTDENEVRSDYWGQHSGVGSQPPKKKPNPGELGMTILDGDTGTVWLVGPGSATPVRSMDDWNKLKFVGVPHAGSMKGIEIVAWAQIFGASEIGGDPI